MKKKIITYGILALVGVGVYFGYNHFFGCKSECTDSCEKKDSTAVVTTATTTVDEADSVAKTTVDTTKK